jgi:hypothetical protein
MGMHDVEFAMYSGGLGVLADYLYEMDRGRGCRCGWVIYSLSYQNLTKMVNKSTASSTSPQELKLEALTLEGEITIQFRYKIV